MEHIISVQDQLQDLCVQHGTDFVLESLANMFRECSKGYAKEHDFAQALDCMALGHQVDLLRNYEVIKKGANCKNC